MLKLLARELATKTCLKLMHHEGSGSQQAVKFPLASHAVECTVTDLAVKFPLASHAVECTVTDLAVSRQ